MTMLKRAVKIRSRTNMTRATKTDTRITITVELTISLLVGQETLFISK